MGGAGVAVGCGAVVAAGAGAFVGEGCGAVVAVAGGAWVGAVVGVGACCCSLTPGPAPTAEGEGNGVALEVSPRRPLGLPPASSALEQAGRTRARERRPLRRGFTGRSS